MPIYAYRSEDGKVIDKFFKSVERPDTVEIDGVVYHYSIGSPMIVSGVGGYKIPSNLKDKLNMVKQHYPKMQSSVTG